MPCFESANLFRLFKVGSSVGSNPDQLTLRKSSAGDQNLAQLFRYHHQASWLLRYRILRFGAFSLSMSYVSSNGQNVGLSFTTRRPTFQIVTECLAKKSNISKSIFAFCAYRLCSFSVFTFDFQLVYLFISIFQFSGHRFSTGYKL